MSESMAAVIKKHMALDDTWNHVPDGKIVCNWTPCNFQIDADHDDLWRGEFAEHVAEQLRANGHGVAEMFDQVDSAAKAASASVERRADHRIRLDESTVNRAAERIADLLQQLGVNPHEGPEYDEGNRLATTSDTVAQTLVRAVLTEAVEAAR